jgi:hypothetical protein
LAPNVIGQEVADELAHVDAPGLRLTLQILAQ